MKWRLHNATLIITSFCVYEQNVFAVFISRNPIYLDVFTHNHSYHLDRNIPNNWRKIHWVIPFCILVKSTFLLPHFCSDATRRWLKGEFINVWVTSAKVYLTQHKHSRLIALAYDGNKFLKALWNTMYDSVQKEQHKNLSVKTHKIHKYHCLV